MHGTRETAWARDELHTKSHRLSKRPPFECIALLSQGARRARRATGGETTRGVTIDAVQICSKLRRALTKLRLNFVADRRRRRATRLPRHWRGSIREKKPREMRAFLFQSPRTRAPGVSVDPLGLALTLMGPIVFPEMFQGLVAIGPVWPAVTPVVRYSVPGWPTVTPVVRYSVPGRFIGACAKANVAGSVKASASAIVVSFMGFSLRLVKRKRGKPRLIIPLNSS